MRGLGIFFIVILIITTNIVAQIGSDQFVLNKKEVQSVVINYNNFISANVDNITYQKPSFLNLTGQFVVGTALSLGFSAIPTILVFSKSPSQIGPGEAIAAVIGVPLYLLGSATGVYWVSKKAVPNISFWNTFAFSCIGGSISIAILLSNIGKVNSPLVFIAALIMPTLSSMLYTNLISTWNRKEVIIDNSITHKDFVEQTKLFNVQLIRINL